MLKLAFLQKNSIVFTDTYYYAFYDSKTNFNDLSEQEKARIREASGVEGFICSKGEIITTGYRDKGISYISKLNTDKIPFPPEEIYCNFLTSIANAGIKRQFDENYNKDHERTGKDYLVTSYVSSLLKKFILSLEKDKKNNNLALDSFSDDKDSQDKNIIDLERLDSTQNYMSRSKLSVDFVESNIGFKDTLLILKFFESYFQITKSMQYMQQHEHKSMHREVGRNIKITADKNGTCPKYNYSEFTTETNRSQLRKRIKSKDTDIVELYAKAVGDLHKLAALNEIEFSELPQDLIDDKYMYSLRTDTFTSLDDYIKNRKAIETSSVKIGSTTISVRERSGDIFSNTVKILKLYKPRFYYKDIIDLLTANHIEYKKLCNMHKAVADTKNLTVTELKKKLANANKMKERYVSCIKNEYDAKTKIYLNKTQLKATAADLREELSRIKHLEATIKELETPVDTTRKVEINKDYISFLNAYKVEFMKLEKAIIEADALDLLDTTNITADLFTKLQSKYGLISECTRQDFLTLPNKLTLNDAIARNVKKGNWEDLGGGWFGSVLGSDSNFIPKLIAPSGHIITTLSQTVVPFYRLTLDGKPLNIDREYYREIFGALNDVTMAYRNFYTKNSETINSFVAWRDQQRQI